MAEVLYRFKSKASGDVLMVDAQAEQVLRALGKDPSPQGIIRAADLAQALAQLQAAIDEDDARRSASGTRGARSAAQDSEQADDAQALSLRRRAWPLVDMLQRAMAERVDIVWGV